MPFATATIIAAAGLAVGAAGTVTNMIGQSEAADAQKKEQNTRELQMNLDASRNRRDIARRALMARSTALSNATNQGAQDSSGLSGGQAQVFGQAGMAMGANVQNQQLGQNMFRYAGEATDAQSMASMGQGISSAGNSIISNKDMLGRVGSYLTGQNTWG